LEDLKEILEWSRRSNVKTMTADGIVFQGPGYLFDVHLAAGGAAADAAVYIGLSTNDKKLGDFDTITNTSFDHRYWPPVYCPVGLYVEVGTLQSISFHYMELRE